MRRSLSLVLAFLAVLTGCQQEIFFENEECKIKKGHYYGGGGMHDSASFIYDPQGRLTKWIHIDGKYDYYYDGSNIIVRKYTENSGQLWYLDSISYNPDNSISAIIFWDYSATYGPDTSHSKIIFEYQGGRVSNLITVDYYDFGLGPETDTLFTNISWNSAGNIEKMLNYSNTPSGGYSDSILYQYDANPNFFQPIHPHFFLLDPQFQLHAGFQPHLAYFYSRNNVSNFNVYGSWDYPVIYGLDSLNNVTSIVMGGFPHMAYEYECPELPAK